MFAMVFKSFHVLLQVFHTLVASLSAVSYECFKCFHLDVSKVDRVAM
jgi:hypothetical protein